MTDYLHHIKIKIPQGRGVLTTVEMDGEVLRGVTAIGFHIDMERNARVTLELVADVEIEGEAEIVKEWRRLLVADRCDSKRLVGEWPSGAVSIQPVANLLTAPEQPAHRGASWQVIQCEESLGHPKPHAIGGFHGYTSRHRGYFWGSA